MTPENGRVDGPAAVTADSDRVRKLELVLGEIRDIVGETLKVAAHSDDDEGEEPAYWEGLAHTAEDIAEALRRAEL